MPTDIESGEFRKKLKLTVGQMIVDPPSHFLPGNASCQTIYQPRNYDRCHRTHAAIVAALVPDVPRAVAFI